MPAQPIRRCPACGALIANNEMFYTHLLTSLRCAAEVNGCAAQVIETDEGLVVAATIHVQRRKWHPQYAIVGIGNSGSVTIALRGRRDHAETYTSKILQNQLG